jgi:hypothetical protein
MLVMKEANKEAVAGNYMCSQCGKSKKHPGGKLGKCDICKSPKLFYTGNEEKDTSCKYSPFMFTMFPV